MSVGDIRGYRRRWAEDERRGWHPKRVHLTVQQSIDRERVRAAEQAKVKRKKK